MMANQQRADALKFELLVPVRSKDSPTACMSFNYHKEHFGEVWGLHNAKGEVLHTGCVAFGMDRLAVALFVTHGADISAWPASVREALEALGGISRIHRHDRAGDVPGRITHQISDTGGDVFHIRQPLERGARRDLGALARPSCFRSCRFA